MPPKYTQPSIPVKRAVLLEKSGHKTLAEKQQWMRDNNIVIHRPAVGSQGFYGFTGTGHVAHPMGINTTGTNNIGMGYSSLATFAGTVGHAGYTGTITGGHNNVAIGVSSFSTFMTQTDYDNLGKVGFKKWRWNFV